MNTNTGRPAQGSPWLRPRVLAVALLAMTFWALGANGGINGGGRARGVITAFGSIFVNGVEYDLTGSQISVNNTPATETELHVGEVVSVDGFVNADGVTGEAATVEFRSDIRGTVSSVSTASSSLKVLGQTVLVNGATAFDPAFVPANLSGVKTGRVVEVSGYRNSSGQLVATRVQREDAIDDRVVGTVSGLDAGSFGFLVNELRVDYSSAMLVDAGLANGVLVEIEGPRAVSGVMHARTVQIEQPELGGDTGAGASLEGIVTTALVNSRFAVNGQLVSISTTTKFVNGTRKDLLLDTRVEVEGRIATGGRIAASKVTFKFDDDAYIFAVVDSVTPATRTVQLVGLTATLDTSTRLEDQSDLRLKPFTLRDLSPGDTVEIRGFEARLPRFVKVQQLIREKADPRTIVGGRVSAIRGREFDLLDLTVLTTSATRYRDAADRAITATRFFTTAANRDVKVRGTWNGTNFQAEQVELQ